MAEHSKKHHSNSEPGAKENVKENVEKVVFVNRCSKVVKGGRRFSFSALIVVGDLQGKVGVGFGKANEVSEAIRKASESGKKEMIKVAITDHTIPHEVIGEHRGGRVLLRPASPGTGIIAGGGVRAVVEAAGIRDILAKSLGSNNHANVVYATIEALKQLRQREEIFKLRGKKYTPAAPKREAAPAHPDLTELELPAAPEPVLIPESFPEDSKAQDSTSQNSQEDAPDVCLLEVSEEIQEALKKVTPEESSKEIPLEAIENLEIVLEETTEEELDSTDATTKEA